MRGEPPSRTVKGHTHQASSVGFPPTSTVDSPSQAGDGPVIEEIEIRVPEDRVGEIFSSDEGESIAGTRVLRLQSTDARLVKVRELHRRKWKEGGYFYSSAVPHRAYTSAELDSSEVLLLRPQALFEPAGEEC